jgi:hypothetical protein
MSSLISDLKNKHWLWQASQHTRSIGDKLPTGLSDLDDALNGGFPNRGVVRINSTMGIGEWLLCTPVIQQRQQDQRQLFIIAAPMTVNSAMLIEQGIPLERTFFIQVNTRDEALWACEQCLSSGVAHSVLLWHEQLSIGQAKRLEVAAEQGDSLLMLFQYQQYSQPLPISLSMSLNRQQHSLLVSIDKQRGGWPVTSIRVEHGLVSVQQRHNLSNTQTHNNVVALHAQR